MLDTTPHPALTQCPRCKGMGVVPLTYRVKAPTAAPQPKRTAKMDFSFLHKRWVKYACFFLAFLFLSALHQTDEAKDKSTPTSSGLPMASERTPAERAAAVNRSKPLSCGALSAMAEYYGMPHGSIWQDYERGRALGVCE
jgi:hypothetical protein